MSLAFIKGESHHVWKIREFQQLERYACAGSFTLAPSCPRCCKSVSVGPAWAEKLSEAGKGTVCAAPSLKGAVRTETASLPRGDRARPLL